MNAIQAYISLLNDTLLHSLIFFPGKAYVGDVMVILGNYNLYMVLVVSLFGSVIGGSINWILGVMFRRFKLFNSTEEKFSKVESFFQKKGKWILLFSMIPLWGNLFTTAAGVARYNYCNFLILVTFSNFIGYSLIIFF